MKASRINSINNSQKNIQLKTFPSFELEVLSLIGRLDWPPGGALDHWLTNENTAQPGYQSPVHNSTVFQSSRSQLAPVRIPVDSGESWLLWRSWRQEPVSRVSRQFVSYKVSQVTEMISIGLAGPCPTQLPLAVTWSSWPLDCNERLQRSNKEQMVQYWFSFCFCGISQLEHDFQESSQTPLTRVSSHSTVWPNTSQGQMGEPLHCEGQIYIWYKFWQFFTPS